MAFDSLKHWSRRQFKPTIRMRVDWDKRINLGLCFCVPLQGARVAPSVTANQGVPFFLNLAARAEVYTQAAFLPLSFGTMGIGAVGTSSFAGLAFVNGTAGYQPIVSSDGAFGGDFTVIVQAEEAAGAAVTTLMSQASSNSKGIYLECNASSSGGASSGSFHFGCYTGSWTNTMAVAGVVDGLPNVWGGRRRGANLDAFKNGGNIGTVSQTALSYADAGASQQLSFGAHRAGASPCLKPIYGIWAWNRALSDQEMAKLGESFWNPNRATLVAA